MCILLSAFRATRYNNIGTAIIDVYVPESLEPGGYKVKVVTSPRKDSLEEFTFAEPVSVVVHPDTP